MWYNHKDHFFNLSLFNQIVRGDDDEICLVNLPHNMDWDHDDEKNICSLKFESKIGRDAAFELIKIALGR